MLRASLAGFAAEARPEFVYGSSASSFLLPTRKIEPALPMQSMLPMLPMLKIDPALPMLRIEPALPMLNTDPALPMLMMLPMLKLLNRLLMLGKPSRLPVLNLPGRSLRLRPERVAPYILVPLCAHYPFWDISPNQRNTAADSAQRRATQPMEDHVSLHLNQVRYRPAQSRVNSPPCLARMRRVEITQDE